MLALLTTNGILLSELRPDWRIMRGGAYEVRVSGGRGEEIVALFVRDRTARSPEEVWSVLRGSRLGPLIRERVLPRSRGDYAAVLGEKEDSAASMDTAWHVAREMLDEKGGEIRLLVSDVRPGSIAERSGVRVGDEILRIEDWDWPAWRVGWESGAKSGLSDGELRLLLQRNGLPIRVTMRPDTGAGAPPTELLGMQAAENLVVSDRPLLLTKPGVTGSSAGLAFTLLYLDHLDDGDLLTLPVAATGTVDPSGWVAGVAGVDLKTEAAAAAGARVLFVPAENLPEARGFPGEVVGVRSVREAVAWLCEHGATVRFCTDLP